jgi:hypothetical protein
MLAKGHGDITRQGCVECGKLDEVYIDGGRSPWTLVFDHVRYKS